MTALRWGLLSTANINRMILGGAAPSERAEVVAVASRDGARAQAYAGEHGIERAHASYEALLADPDVDAVYISLPNGMHHEWTMRALEAGKHVLCEKPYSRRPADVEEGFAKAEASGLVLMEAFMYRHHPQTREVERLVRDGALGRLVSVTARFTFPLTDLANVRALADLDGGALMDVGCYCISGARLVAGEPQEVAAHQVTGSTGVDMGLYGAMRFADDVVAIFEASFLAPVRQSLEIAGEDGVLTVDSPFRIDWPGEARLRRGDDVRVLDLPAADSYRL
ncbi:MAG TPA: Gfo/Idh/MocA family oxidoreductase, partial [Gaiellaceae bacterium]|nr:Gfo/Idh/MocA family oxidoreductase [Gaiellaceae bacterium]